MYISSGFSSSSMSRREKTINFLFISTFDGLLMKFDQVPFVYFEILWASDSPPSIPPSTSSKSERSGGSTDLKSESGVISFSAYVSVMALSIKASSSAVRPPSMILKRPTRFMMFDRSTEALDSSSAGIGNSNGFMWWSEFKDMLKYLPPTASAIYSYSLSGSSTMTSASNMRVLKISSLVIYDLPEPDFANMTEL